MKKVLITLACMPLLTACVIRIDTEDNYLEMEQALELSASGLNNLVADTGAGRLLIIGEANRTNIEVYASINYHDEEDVELRLERRGDSAVLEAGMNYNFYNDNPPIINLTVRVPDTFDLTLDDGSGHIEIVDVSGNIKIDDGSGHIDVRGGHDISVDDGSGHIKIVGASGNVDIKDDSGHLEVYEVKGDVSVDDESGHMTLRFIGGSVEIVDGSGNIEVDEAGALNLVEAGSGKLSIRNVRGRTSVGE